MREKLGGEEGNPALFLERFRVLGGGEKWSKEEPWVLKENYPRFLWDLTQAKHFSPLIYIYLPQSINYLDIIPHWQYNKILKGKALINFSSENENQYKDYEEKL